ncbi:MAG TPA: serine hydrolase domain-containing protein, partial [Flavisolibacter sp.]|nr:serine hydrolase domain-containing protein [Flavisolibacter sp.]
MKKYFFCFILLITASASFTQSNNNYQPAFFSDPNKIDTLKETSSLVDKLFKEHAVKNHFPGMVYALVADGQVLYSGSYGFSDIKNKTPATQKSAFRIASMTKSITALAIVKLRDAGKLRLDDPVHLYIPEMKNQKLTKDAPFITIRDLLT